MRTPLAALIIALFPLSLAGQDSTTAPTGPATTGEALLSLPAPRKFKHKAPVTATYDRLADVTRASVLVHFKHGFAASFAASLCEGTCRAPEVYTLLSYAYVGKVPKGLPETIRATFVLVERTSAKQASRQSARADIQTRVVLLADSADRLRLEADLADSELDFSADYTRGSTKVVYVTTLALSQLVRIANARIVEGRVGAADFVWKEQQLEAIRDFASRMTPSASPP